MTWGELDGREEEREKEGERQRQKDIKTERQIFTYLLEESLWISERVAHWHRIFIATRNKVQYLSARIGTWEFTLRVQL